jgi:hypothetical protein
MRFLSKYLDFIFESVAKKEMRLYYSDDFRNMLKKIQVKSSVAQALLLSEGSNQMLDIYTLIDITEKNDTISLIQVNRIVRGNPELGEGLPYNIRDKKSGSEFWTKGRTEIKIGRWATRIFTEVHKTDLPASKIEEFVNLYKASIDGTDLNNFELVEGEDIKKWYYENNYELRRGQLGNSCMRYYKCQDFFDIYVKNPEVCKLLILKSAEKDKITGRALVWKLIDGDYYMDRIYTINDSDKLLFKDYARVNKIENLYDVNSNRYNLEVKLGDHTYDKYPYMDTFVVYNPTTKILKDDEDLWPGQGYISLQNTNGGFGDENAVWSEWMDEYLNRDIAVYCDNVSDWLTEVEARYLEYKDTWAAPTDDVVYSNYHGEYFYMDDCVHSELMNDYLYPDNEDVIEIEISSNDTDFIVKSRKDLYFERIEMGKTTGTGYTTSSGVATTYFLRDNLIKDPYDGKYYLKYEKIDGVKYEEYLDEKIKKDIGITSEKVTRKQLNEIKEDLYNLLKEFKITDEILKEIKNSSSYLELINGSNGKRSENLLGKENMPTDEDIFNTLKVYMILNNKFNPNTPWWIINPQRYYMDYLSVYQQFIGLHDEDVDENLKIKFNMWKSEFLTYSKGILHELAKIAYSFDYSLFPDEIYKRYLFINLDI